MNTLRATRYLRPLNRHQASEHFIVASDGHCYSVNLEERWGTESSILNAVGSCLCQVAEIETAAPAILNVDADLIALGMSGGTTDLGGAYLGKRYPVDPETTAIYDFLPDILLAKVKTRADFWKMISIDLWLGNPRASKALFYREAPESQSFRSTMVFRSARGPIVGCAAGRGKAELPSLTIGHYCGNGGSATAERVAAMLVAMNSTDVEALLEDLLGDSIDRFASTIGRVVRDLTAGREAIFMQLPEMSQALQHRVDAVKSGRIGPHTEVAGADLAGAFFNSLKATA